MNNTPTITTTRTASRLTLLALLAVFMLPLFLAWLFARGPLDWQPKNNLNYGVLLQPPLQLNTYGVMNATGGALTVNANARDWFVVVFFAGTDTGSGATACAEACRQLIEVAERLPLAIGGRDAYRVSLALLSLNGEATIQQGQDWRLPADREQVQELRRALGDTLLDVQLLIVDYQGYVVLSYLPTEDGLGVLEDLKRLLRSAAS